MYETALITIFLTILLSIIFAYYHRLKFRCVSNIPGPPEFLFFGNLLEFGNSLSDVFNALVRINKQYGPIVRIWEGPFVLRLMLSDPKYLEVIMNSQVHIEKPANYDLFKPWIGQGLITSSGQIWRKHRKLITPTLHFKILDQFFDVFNGCGDVLTKILKNEVGKSNVNIFPILKLYALDIVSETSMGVKINAQSKENPEYVGAIQQFLDILMRRYFSLLKRFDFYYKFTEDCQNEKKSLKILNDMTRRVVEERKIERTKYGDNSNKLEQDLGIKKKVALLDLLLDQKDQFTDKELCDEVNTFFFAGHDTISCVLSFCLFQTAKCQEMQQQMLEEIHLVIGEDKNKPITLNHTQELKFMERFIKEVMRFYPPVPFYERQLKQSVVIDKYTIPEGTRIMLFAHGMHYNEEYYPNPEKFDPDRFLPENVSARHPFAFIPFSAGPRNCIGQRFAMSALKYTMAHVIRNFLLEPIVPEHKFIFGNDAILKSMNGIPLRVNIRK